MSETKSFYFNPRGKGVGVFLGPTESRLMEICWNNKALTVKKAIFQLGEKNNLAYTTVMTVLGNLAEKGLLKKEKQGRLFVYNPAIDKKNFIKERVHAIEKCLRLNFGKV
jgi:predicted transcriptional regulator